MALPAGFDPNRMSFGPSAPVIDIPRNNTTSYSSVSWTGSYRRQSLWSRFNEGVAAIGNWFSDNVESTISVLSLIVVAGTVITALVYIISAWINSGFWMAVLVTVIAGIVGTIGLGISWYVINIAVNVVMFGLRFIFWNGWTLVIALLLMLSVWLIPKMTDFSSTPQYTPVERVSTAPATRTYRCTASVLNIRSEPSTGSSVIGVLQRGQTVEVHHTYREFARIDYNGRVGYVSTRYLEEI